MLVAYLEALEAGGLMFGLATVLADALENALSLEYLLYKRIVLV